MVKRYKFPAEAVAAFRARHGIRRQEDLENLLGFTSEGRSARRWEADGAPPYVEVLLAYLDTYGLDLAKRIEEKRNES